MTADAATEAVPTFRHPFTMCVSGCTGSGKSQWVLRFLQHMHQLVTPGPPRLVLYCYGELNANILRLQQQEAQQQQQQQQWMDKNKEGSGEGESVGENVRGSDGAARETMWHLQVHNGVPEEGQLRQLSTKCGGQLLVVLDDLMVGLRASLLDVLFTRGSHNWGCSVLLVTQHLFASRELRVARNNCHYLVLMRNPVGALQIRNLATQLFPGPRAHRFFMEAYEDATREPFDYLLVDMHPRTRDAFRLKTHIYPGGGYPCTIYMPVDGIATARDSG